MKKYKAMLAEMFTSKKFHALIGGIGTVLSQDTVPGLAMSEKTLVGVVALIIAYVMAQGAADFNKSAAQIKANAEAPRKK